MEDRQSGLGHTRLTTEQIVEAQQSHIALDKQWVAKLKATNQTPSVANIEKFRAGNTAPANITDFINGQEGQTIKVLGDGQSTVVHDTTKVRTNTGANKLLAAHTVYTFTMFNGVWIEDE